ncbi:ruBisCO large subunit-binding protein subunit alpha-like isoform X2 [Oryza brachyantha]|uniref:ruBisCO large subunit-binding protein subunit alpha-like isoform X2 n=1 Tax=Oryza brachyantha TaxID=4533 RepID=UPI001ADD0996|nr:ruBisCO large subunit-binding protein subunit alpha-like isoform X2 [Oryza brachyantha]XP_040376356.1 ruBisCO large subunit-binding protein subunit alpha-like isoform X2 [Oryza brachyantha]XP_040376357.1 ruBisCO large subunit-binding protein subunit alpha-like isoform X2 [Oryza brachyantha]XP_040376358.1 ruBisCO large subunit-binding protein subunit alpha-like isoform X2 [Oryza brachyantha]
MNLDDIFEQKNDVAKAVLEELEKVTGEPLIQGKDDTAALLKSRLPLPLSLPLLASGNDELIGSMIADAIDKVGPDGVLSIDSSSFEITVDVEEGKKMF